MQHKIKENLKGESKTNMKSTMRIEREQQKQCRINNKDIRR